jgi:hypothetical protein
MNKDYRIKVSSSKYVEGSRAVAVIRLNERGFLKGEVVMLNYKKDPDKKTDIGTLVAIGIKDGTGEDCYRIISAGGSVVVRKVVESLADVSSLVHNELYIYKDPDNKWYYVYKPENEANRRIELITGGPYIFVDLDTGYRWFYRDGQCKREDEFFSSNNVQALLNEILSRNDRIEVTSDSGFLFKVGDVKNVALNIKTLDNSRNDISSKCRYSIDGQDIALVGGKYTIQNLTADKDIEIVSNVEVAEGIYQQIKEKVSIRFGYLFYYGRVEPTWEPNVDNIKALEYKKLNNRRSLEWVDIDITNLSKTVFCYPKRYGFLDHIFDYHGIDYLKDYVIYDNHYVIDGEEYFVYLKKEPIKMFDFRQNYVFGDFDGIIINGVGDNQLGDLLDHGIKEQLKDKLLDFKTSGVVYLDGMFDEVPTSGLVPGGIYYIKSIKKLFVADSDSSGVVKDMTEKSMYVKLPEYSTLFWNGTELIDLGKLRVVKIDNISEIF